MTIRNLVIAAGAVLAAGSALAAPTMASAQDFYRPIYRPAPVAYRYDPAFARYEHRRIEERRYEAFRRNEWRRHHEFRRYSW